ncbi:glyceraldehyde-3-phosphate dehydrogenase, type I [Paraphysoderma sedebokerense]|nr:glyceraldehyde-3-phosphate dehydrogenase, type I [Paraphysoderma sedebokerense]
MQAAPSRKSRVLINGFGRMGRLFLRAYFDIITITNPHHFDIVCINEIKCDAASSAHLLEFDSIKGIWKSQAGKIHANTNHIFVGSDYMISYSSHDDFSDIAWTQLNIDIVVECTGKNLTKEVLKRYFEFGVKKVVVSSPVKFDEALNIVMGVNHHLYDPTKHHIVTNASCTTNCLAPIVKVILPLGITRATMTTMHCVTNTQTIVDSGHKDLRRGRSCLLSLVPTTTGSATAITSIYPSLKGKINGLAVRVPLLNASLTDVVFELENETTKEKINELLKNASEGELEGILGFEERPLVGEDFRGDTRSSIVDALSTMVVDKTMVKILAWYDNEQGYCWRMLELVEWVAASL